MPIPSHLRALLTTQDEQTGKCQQRLETKALDFLPPHEVLIEVQYSSLNYKDVLSAFGKNKITRSYPHITGIDAAGVVVRDTTQQFSVGEEVIVTGYDLGMNTFGGHASHIGVPASWVVRKPNGLSLFQCMALGTAGFTVGLAWQKMHAHLEVLRTGEFLVTGASGGVGSLAVSLLTHEGLHIVASSSKSPESLEQLGAKKVIPPADILGDASKPLRKPLWVGALDNLGGDYLASILSTAHKEACIVSVGLVASPALPTTVLPFILNGVNLLGINSADTPMTLRTRVWTYLASRVDFLSSVVFPKVETIPLDLVPARLQVMMDGKAQGRVVVKV